MNHNKRMRDMCWWDEQKNHPYNTLGCGRTEVLQLAMAVYSYLYGKSKLSQCGNVAKIYIMQITTSSSQFIFFSLVLPSIHDSGSVSAMPAHCPDGEMLKQNIVIAAVHTHTHWHIFCPIDTHTVYSTVYQWSIFW